LESLTVKFEYLIVTFGKIVFLKKLINTYFLGIGDRVLCFQCGGGLKDWDPKDGPWVEHAKWFGSCPYLAMKKGKEFINQVILTNKEPIDSSQFQTDNNRYKNNSLFT